MIAVSLHSTGIVKNYGASAALLEKYLPAAHEFVCQACKVLALVIFQQAVGPFTTRKCHQAHIKYGQFPMIHCQQHMCTPMLSDETDCSRGHCPMHRIYTKSWWLMTQARVAMLIFRVKSCRNSKAICTSFISSLESSSLNGVLGCYSSALWWEVVSARGKSRLNLSRYSYRSPIDQISFQS